MFGFSLSGMSFFYRYTIFFNFFGLSLAFLLPSSNVTDFFGSIPCLLVIGHYTLFFYLLVSSTWPVASLTLHTPYTQLWLSYVSTLF